MSAFNIFDKKMKITVLSILSNGIELRHLSTFGDNGR